MQDGKTFLIGVVAILFFFISFKGCKDENNGQLQYQQNGNFEKSPVDVLIRDLNSEQNFNITLMDMDFSEETDKYKHKYNILVERPDSVYAKETAWLPVSAAFFNANMENMGMEIASKLDGKVSKNTAPILVTKNMVSGVSAMVEVFGNSMGNMPLCQACSAWRCFLFVILTGTITVVIITDREDHTMGQLVMAVGCMEQIAPMQKITPIQNGTVNRPILNRGYKIR
jgi:hypothetical protein